MVERVGEDKIVRVGCIGGEIEGIGRASKKPYCGLEYGKTSSLKTTCLEIKVLPEEDSQM